MRLDSSALITSAEPSSCSRRPAVALLVCSTRTVLQSLTASSCCVLQTDQLAAMNKKARTESDEAGEGAMEAAFRSDEHNREREWLARVRG